MSNYFKVVLVIRFIGYFAFISGMIFFFVTLGPLMQVEFNYRKDQLFGIKRTLPKVITSQQPGSDPGQTAPTSFGNLSVNSYTIVPVSTDFGIVIEKINANAKVVPNVNPADERVYTQALTQGVAHALGANFPGEKGNIYLFSHSTDAPWNIVRYNAVFYLLRELEKGDKVVMFYNGRRYDYVIYDKVIAEPNDVSFLTNKYDKSVLTLQTCDPPGTLLKRLIVRAQLEGE